MKLTTLSVRNQDFLVEVDEQGRFSAELSGATLYASTLEDLTTKLMTATKKAAAKLSIPIISPSGNRGTVTGQHGANGNLLVTWEDGHKSQERYYHDWLQDMDNQTVTQYRQAVKVEKEARAELAKWQTKYRYRSLDKTIQEAIDDYAKGPSQ